MRELRPRPVKVEESVSGALLGLFGVCGRDAVDFCSTFGLEENSEDMTCAGWRGLGCAWGTERGATDGRSVCCRGRLGGRSSAVCVRALRFSILFDLSLKAVSTVMLGCRETHLSVHRPPFLVCSLLVDGPSSRARFKTKVSLMTRTGSEYGPHHSGSSLLIWIPTEAVTGWRHSLKSDSLSFLVLSRVLRRPL
jgi:hypothetical protein